MMTLPSTIPGTVAGPHPPRHQGQAASIAALYRTVRLTARGSGLLFAGAQATSALGPPAGRASRPLYLGFLAVHAVHFVAVARYAVATSGRGLFPGGRSMNEVGGWPTVLGIYALFAGLAVTGRPTAWPSRSQPPALRRSARAATGIIATMFVGTYFGQLTRSGWYALPAAAIATATTANLLANRHRRQSPLPTDDQPQFC
jgi:hypothetical protein